MPFASGVRSGAALHRPPQTPGVTGYLSSSSDHQFEGSSKLFCILHSISNTVVHTIIRSPELSERRFIVSQKLLVSAPAECIFCLVPQPQILYQEDAGPGGTGRKAKQVRNKAEQAEQGQTRRNKAEQRRNTLDRGGTKGYLGEHLGKRFVLSDGRNTAEQGRTKAEQGGTKPNMAEQAEQGKTKAELFRPLCAQGPYPVPLTELKAMLVACYTQGHLRATLVPHIICGTAQTDHITLSGHEKFDDRVRALLIASGYNSTKYSTMANVTFGCMQCRHDASETPKIYPIAGGYTNDQ
eukprot:scaffold83447_cov83-Cyclotella_meneghiniana.AAC.3